MFRSFLPGASACFCFDGDGFELPCSAVCARSSTRRPLPKLRHRSASSAWLVCFFLTGWVKLAPNPLSFLYACSSFPTAADAERPCRRLCATMRRAAEYNEPHLTGEGSLSWPAELTSKRFKDGSGLLTHERRSLCLSELRVALVC